MSSDIPRLVPHSPGKPRIFFSVGEPSGDLHAANLIEELTSLSNGSMEFSGFGGPKMEAAGCRLDFQLTDLALMGVGGPLRHLTKFRELRRQAEESFRLAPPDAVLLIDYPGFNWHIARTAKRCGVPVFYYGLPQMWAWAPWRVRKMRRLVDHALCTLPFEQAWLEKRGCQATYVGHPFFDHVSQQKLDGDFLRSYDDEKSRLLVLLPGSRDAEVRANLDTLLEAGAIVQRQLPQVAVAVACYKPEHAEMARRRARDIGCPVDALHGRTAELIQMADVCAACSGSVSLELMARRKPSVIVYQLPPVQWRVLCAMLCVRYITLPNLLAADDIGRRWSQRLAPSSILPAEASTPFPEYLTCRNTAPQVAEHLVRWLSDSAAYQSTVSQLSELVDRFGQLGANRRAAEYILQQMHLESATDCRQAHTLRAAA